MVIMYTFITCSVGATERTKPAYVYVRVPDNRGNAWLSCQFSSPLIHLQYDLGVSSYYSMSSQYIAHTRTRVSTRIYSIVGGFHGMVASNAIQSLPFLSFPFISVIITFTSRRLLKASPCPCQHRSHRALTVLGQ